MVLADRRRQYRHSALQPETPYPGQNHPTVAKGDKLIKKDFLGQAHRSFIAKSHNHQRKLTVTLTTCIIFLWLKV